MTILVVKKWWILGGITLRPPVFVGPVAVKGLFHPTVTLNYNWFEIATHESGHPRALETGENQLFGDERTDKRHFTEFSKTKDQAGLGMIADQSTINKLNPLHYIKNAKTNIAQYWRIRHGTKDKDTSLAVPTLLALTLTNYKSDVDYELAWDKPHSGDYDIDELFNWAESKVHN